MRPLHYEADFDPSLPPFGCISCQPGGSSSTPTSTKVVSVCIYTGSLHVSFRHPPPKFFPPFFPPFLSAVLRQRSLLVQKNHNCRRSYSCPGSPKCRLQFIYRATTRNPYLAPILCSTVNLAFPRARALHLSPCSLICLFLHPWSPPYSELPHAVCHTPKLRLPRHRTPTRARKFPTVFGIMGATRLQPYLPPAPNTRIHSTSSLVAPKMSSRTSHPAPRLRLHP